MRKDIVVADVGSGCMKIGFAGSRTPEHVFPTMLGTPVAGKRVFGLRGLLKVVRPVVRGRVKSWDAMRLLWDFSFSLLDIKPSSCKVLVTEPLFNTKKDREKLAEIMFEYFNVRGLYIAEQPVLSFYAHGSETGLIVDIGHGLTQVAPIYEGFAVPRAARVAPLGGGDITLFLVRLLLKRGYNLAGSVGFEIAKDIKERMCYIALDPEAEAKKMGYALEEEYYRGLPEKEREISKKGLYRLSDGTLLKLGEELFMAPEVLFRPSLMRLDAKPLPNLILDSIFSCDIDQRAALLKNIILCGGTSLLKGLDKRLEKEMKAILAKKKLKVKPKVVAPRMREFYAWIGASKFALALEAGKLWITERDYREAGPSVVNEKAKPVIH